MAEIKPKEKLCHSKQTKILCTDEYIKSHDYDSVTLFEC